MGEGHVADGGHQRQGDHGDRDRDGVPAQVGRRDKLGEHELVEEGVDRGRGGRPQLSEPAPGERAEKGRLDASRRQPAPPAPVVGVAELERHAGQQRGDGGVEREPPHEPQRDDRRQAERGLADPDQVPAVRARGLKGEGIAGADERDNGAGEDNAVSARKPRVPVRQDGSQGQADQQREGTRDHHHRPRGGDIGSRVSRIAGHVEADSRRLAHLAKQEEHAGPGDDRGVLAADSGADRSGDDDAAECRRGRGNHVEARGAGDGAEKPLAQAGVGLGHLTGEEAGGQRHAALSAAIMITR